MPTTRSKLNDTLDVSNIRARCGDQVGVGNPDLRSHARPALRTISEIGKDRQVHKVHAPALKSLGDQQVNRVRAPAPKGVSEIGRTQQARVCAPALIGTLGTIPGGTGGQHTRWQDPAPIVTGRLSSTFGSATRKFSLLALPSGACECLGQRSDSPLSNRANILPEARVQYFVGLVEAWGSGRRISAQHKNIVFLVRLGSNSAANPTDRWHTPRLLPSLPLLSPDLASCLCSMRPTLSPDLAACSHSTGPTVNVIPAFWPTHYPTFRPTRWSSFDTCPTPADPQPPAFWPTRWSLFDVV